MKLSITLILFVCASLVMAQSTKIDEEERARLENRFKALKTFYINDDGLVVYQIQEARNDHKDSVASDEITSHTNVDEYTATRSNNDVKTQNLDSEVDNNIEKKRVTDDGKTVNQISNIVSKRPVNNNTIVDDVIDQKSQSAVSYETNRPTTGSGQTQVINKRPANTTEVSKDKSPSTLKEKDKAIAIPSDTPLVKESKSNQMATAAKSVEVVDQKKDNIVKDGQAEKKRTSGKYTYKKGSVFDKSPLKYKDMEEAAMAVDDLLDKLKKEQAQSNTHSGSMSSKIGRGARKSTLKKQTISDSSIIDDMGIINNNVRANQTALESEFDDDPDIYTPTYYINGQEVSKQAVDNLKKREIISREIRTRNTLSGNPAGEVWIEVKSY